MVNVMATDITLWIAFSAGILSFISPCTLPLYPAFLSYITGVSVQDLERQDGHSNKQVRRKVVVHSVFFLIGISTIYIALGISASFIGQFFIENRILIRQVSGVLIVVMGLFLIGLFNPAWLMKERRLQFSKKPVGYVGSIFIGMGFAAGWTPCLGPILTVILALSASEPSYGMTYMILYIIGFALPFIILSFFIGSTRWVVKYSSIIMKIGGALMIIMGVLLYTGKLFIISSYLFQLFDGTWLTRIG